MPEIDVTDVLIDNDVAGTSFTVLRRQEVVGINGVSSVNVLPVFGVLGAVQPTGDNSLMREEAYDAQAKTLKIITSFRLRGVSTSNALGYKPDQVVWPEGGTDVYEVRVVDDWSQFGGGQIEAECVQITYVGQPPSPLAPYVGRLDFSQPVNAVLAHGSSL